jgi:hypothetical protein
LEKQVALLVAKVSDVYNVALAVLLTVAAPVALAVSAPISAVLPAAVLGVAIGVAVAILPIGGRRLGTMVVSAFAGAT